MNIYKSMVLILLLCSFSVNVYSQSYLQKAESSFISGDIKQATRYYQMQLRDFPESIAARVGLAQCYFRSGYLGRTSAYVDEVLKMDADNSVALLLKGKLYLKRKDWKAAKKILQKLIKNNPDFQEAYTPLSSAHYHLGERKEADEVFEKLKARRGNS